MTDKTRSIEIEHRDGSSTLVSEIPATAKITFGPVQPGGKGYPGENVLRIYTSQSNQLAVFRDVASFRDLSLTVKVTEVTITDHDEETRSPRGSRSQSSRLVKRQYVDNDL